MKFHSLVFWFLRYDVHKVFHMHRLTHGWTHQKENVCGTEGFQWRGMRMIENTKNVKSVSDFCVDSASGNCWH